LITAGWPCLAGNPDHTDQIEEGSVTNPRRQAAKPTHAWKLQDAKAHFSQVVRDAQQHGPQRVTVHGKDAVVILSAEEYDRLAPASQPSLSAVLSNSPLKDLAFDHTSVRAPVRDVEL
jgi:prevent-host-death family protein